MHSGWKQLIQDSEARNLVFGMESIHVRILEERGPWRQDLRTLCKIDNPKAGSNTKRIDNPECLRPIDGRQCCARAIHSAQHDFLAQKSRLGEIIEAAGHLVMFYPKFHCEINWVEYYWRSCKLYARKHCNYTLASVYKVVLDALESVPDTLVFKHWRRTQRIIQVGCRPPSLRQELLLILLLCIPRGPLIW